MAPRCTTGSRRGPRFWIKTSGNSPAPFRPPSACLSGLSHPPADPLIRVVARATSPGDSRMSDRRGLRHPHIFLAVHEPSEPQLEVDERPQPLHVLDAPRHVLSNEAAYHVGIENAPAPRALAQHQLGDHPTPPAAEPRPYRVGKPYFGSCVVARRQLVYKDLTQDPSCRYT